MNLNVFNYQAYVPFLKKHIGENRAGVRGYQGKLASHMGCHPTFLSQVLSERAHLTLDHGFALASFLGLPEKETEYLLCLIEKARAGSNGLSRYLAAKLRKQRAEYEHDQGTSLIAQRRLSSEEDEIFYFRFWYRPAVHMLIRIYPQITAPEISQRLGISMPEVEESLAGFEERGFLTQEKERWKVNVRAVHLPPNAPITEHFHALWRMRASLRPPTPKELRYTGLHTLSESAVAELRAVLSSFLNDYRRRAEDSGEEALTLLNIDFLLL